MKIPRILTEKYMENDSLIELLKNNVQSTLIPIFSEKGYAFLSRKKTIESLAEKIETGRFSSFSDLDDLYACTVIVPTLLDEEEIIDIIKEYYRIIEIKKRNSINKSPEVFRFDNTRIICQLIDHEEVKSEMFDLKFEVQIKTALEHAWSISTHAITYKADEISWKKMRLASQIKANIEQLDMLLYNFEKTSDFIAESPYERDITKIKFLEQIKVFFENKTFPSELRPKDLSRFVDNLFKVLEANKLLKPNKIDEIFDYITKEIASDGKSNKIPQSLSLLQYILIILSKKQDLRNTSKYYYNITDEVIAFNKNLANLEYIFKY